MIGWFHTLAILAAGDAAPPIDRAARTYIAATLGVSRYRTASVDLDRDGRRELLVYADGPGDCGSGGCSLYILTRGRRGYRTVASTSVTRTPIRVLSSASRGWRDLGVRVSGGGITPFEARLRFDGRRYPDNPSIAPPVPAATSGTVVLR